jgi:hypothetical protein
MLFDALIQLFQSFGIFPVVLQLLCESRRDPFGSHWATVAPAVGFAWAAAACAGGPAGP